MENNYQTTYLLSSLTGKLRRDQSEFSAMLLTQPAPYILNRAEEYAVREKIIACISCDILSLNQIIALLNEPHPLRRIYERISALELIAINELIGAIFEEANASINQDTVREAIEMLDFSDDDI